ncbi:MAG: DUF4093 domain-containing protein [Oscillospiraceae bacterium]|jgi:ribonuclease M5|nr:DUF4093 domain-containing protein [Oscillospiraceae bacterium]
MREKPRITPAVIVEGKYDKIALESLFDALILTTGGFRIFNDPKTRALLRSLGERQGLVLLTDSDSAGFLIRRHLSGILPRDRITHLYIPDIPGREKRKKGFSKEGKLGVEGIPAPVLIRLFGEAGLICGEEIAEKDPITPMDLYDAGLSGRENSKELREALKRELDLPARLSAKALPAVLTRLLTRGEFLELAERVSNGCV